jgi:hypothetical protein
MPDLPDTFDRYKAPLPYEVLGVSTDADAREIRDRHNELQRNLQEAGVSASDRGREAQRLESAYNQLRVAGNRMRVDFFLLDASLGAKQCEAAAKALARPALELKGVLKPRTFRVSHAVLLGDLERFVQEPAKVVGLHPRLMELGADELPEPLALDFDC